MGLISPTWVTYAVAKLHFEGDQTYGIYGQYAYLIFVSSFK